MASIRKRFKPCIYSFRDQMPFEWMARRVPKQFDPVADTETLLYVCVMRLADFPNNSIRLRILKLT